MSGETSGPAVTGWIVLRDDERELYKVLLELREDGAIVLHRLRTDRSTGIEYGGFIRIAAPEKALRRLVPEPGAA